MHRTRVRGNQTPHTRYHRLYIDKTCARVTGRARLQNVLSLLCGRSPQTCAACAQDRLVPRWRLQLCGTCAFCPTGSCSGRYGATPLGVEKVAARMEPRGVSRLPRRALDNSMCSLIGQTGTARHCSAVTTPSYSAGGLELPTGHLERPTKT